MKAEVTVEERRKMTDADWKAFHEAVVGAGERAADAMREFTKALAELAQHAEMKGEKKC